MNRPLRPPLLALLLAALLASAPAMGQSPVEITAESFTVAEADRRAVFSGNVVVVHPSVTLRAPTVIVLYGPGGASDISRFEAEGGVRLTLPDQTATGQRAVFDPRARTLRLTGDVVVVNAGGTVRGGELVVDLATNVSTFVGGEGRVTVVLPAQ